MTLGLILAAAVAVATPASPPVELSPQTRSLIAPVHQAIVEAQAELARLPPAKDDTEKLMRMQVLDQAPRKVIQVDYSKIPASERAAARAAIWAEIKPIDEANLEALLAMLPPEGWFPISRYGKEGSAAAFLIVQHSDISQWSRFVPVLQRLAAAGEVRGGDYALMYDRLALHQGRAQRYGSQMTCKAGKYVPDYLEEPDRIDERRATLGMTPYKEYLALFANDPPC